MVAVLAQRSTLQVTLAELVSRRRASLGMTQEQVEELAGVSQNTIHKIESGATKQPRMETLERLGRVLDLSLDDFRRAMGWVLNKDTSTYEIDLSDPLVDFAAHNQDKLTTEQKQRLVEMAKQFMSELDDE